mmetsp:Transcript_17047/g.25755  ORF Transcript_17047/g.25755 Transcript_17047/m.25755 type:complete len:231 (-) Transcript_17047:172-864(-)|eukprot:CAMPEP_0194765210 /NCGR_PEP_ID=MMETSP0323_2-20130528/25420_1 /TAXON_ID=2866 ORGANISM="Crypthecodinium cohnii, Strain Seligo" /NCGR_SAMPLE_ID=MMETSP0323_2 /ASSEMBLY_ACC=CAM_ASM_000346 /LENGTH=230 /DNA_ID=CAMNT_0039694131 /DNA_START=130 /DNA_END=822 /DNA_ORIENTATION=+
MEAFDAGLILLHGSGDQGEGLQAWLKQVSGKQWERTLKIKVVYPDAPLTPYTMAGGEDCRVWFDRQALSYSAPEDEDGVRRSVEQVDQEIDKMVQEGIPLRRIGVGGFSMGGCLAMHVVYGCGRYSGELGLCASMSTFLPARSCLDDIANAIFVEGQGGQPPMKAPPIFMAHGTEDRMINVAWAEDTRRRLEECNIPVPEVLPLYDGMAHELSPDEVGKLAKFVGKHLMT